MATALNESAPLSTSAYHARSTTPKSPIQAATFFLHYDRLFLSVTRPLYNHCSTYSRHCHYNRIVIQLPFNDCLLLSYIKSLPIYGLQLNNCLFQGRSKVSPLHTYHVIYNGLSKHINLLCIPVHQEVHIACTKN